MIVALLYLAMKQAPHRGECAWKKKQVTPTRVGDCFMIGWFGKTQTVECSTEHICKNRFNPILKTEID